MITKPRTDETFAQIVEQERRLSRVRLAQAVINIALAIGGLYMMHVTYIHVWRMMTGH